jgi:uncharacterized membrane protein (UPF0127 family)
MGRKSLPEYSGMLFVFPDENYRSFWMKNTLIPLDMMFIAANGTVLEIRRNVQPCSKDPCETYRSVQKSMFVLEVNAGFSRQHGIGEGSRADLNYKEGA